MVNVGTLVRMKCCFGIGRPSANLLSRTGRRTPGSRRSRRIRTFSTLGVFWAVLIERANHRLPAAVSPCCRNAQETFAMPCNDGRRLYDNQRRMPFLPDRRKPHPQQVVCKVQPWALDRSLKDADLMAERNVLHLESGTAFQEPCCHSDYHGGAATDRIKQFANDGQLL